jgi:hypothetical protein
MRFEPTERAKLACAHWLAACLRLGWPKSVLDDLEAIWWKFHDCQGRLREVKR